MNKNRTHRKFILRVEILAGLIIGAAAAAVAVAFILLLLVRMDLAAGTEASHSSALLGLYTWLLIGFGILTLSLVILSVTFSKYLGNKMIAPLREILTEAETYRTGSGANPETAGASFHELIVLLNKRDRELQKLREIAEARADKAEKRSSIILSALGSAVFSIDSDENLTLFNREAAELLNLTDDDIGCKFPFEKSVTGRHIRDILQNTPGEQMIADIPFQIENQDCPGKRYFSVSVSKSEMGEYAVLINDTTRITELERSTADQKALADIGAASAGISHEMGNTLCALQGFIDLLARGQSDKRTTRIIEETRLAVDDARKLIASLRSLSGSPEPVTNILPVSEIAEICRAECVKLEITHHLLANEICTSHITVDIKLLQTVIRNILSNANDSCDNVSVAIDIRCTDGSLLISITDDGPGLTMNPEEIFRPFSTTKRRESNMGLGLPISRRIIRLFGGDIKCKPRRKAGTEFIIELPLSHTEGTDE